MAPLWKRQRFPTFWPGLASLSHHAICLSPRGVTASIRLVM